MRVVVTRPEIAARRTADKLRVLGHEPILLPLTRAAHYPDFALNALGRPHSTLAVTSAEALRVLGSLGEQLIPYLNETLYAVGEATAKAASEAGFRNIRTGSGSGADLARIIIARSSKETTTLLYLAGRPRSFGFEEGLRRGNKPFAVAEIYEMLPIAHDEPTIAHALVDPPADAVLLYSRENARLFFTLARPQLSALRSLRILCLSAKVADIVPPEFHRNIKIADHPEEDGLLALL